MDLCEYFYLRNPYSMKKISSMLLACLISLTATMTFSCKKENRWDLVKRTGKITTDIRTLDPFTKIEVKDNVNVCISQGSAQEVKIEAGVNLIPLIKTEVIAGVLYIHNDNRCNWARSYKNGIINVYVTAPTLRHIWHLGSGLVKSNDIIACDTLDIWAHQTGDIDLIVNANIIYANAHATADITLSGKSALVGIYHSGEGTLHLEDLQAAYIWSFSQASGDEYLNVQGDLAATIDWVGNIYYSGNPAVLLKGSGKGKLIHEN